MEILLKQLNFLKILVYYKKEKEQKGQKGGLSSMLLDTLGASLLGNILAVK